MAIQSGISAPDFVLLDDAGIERRLSDYRGQNVILYFYPKDNTPGCTAEACSLRDVYGDLLKYGYDVVGVSADSAKSHKGFIEKQRLPFRLIADTDKQLLKAYGAWGEKKMYGKTYEGIIRITFIISEDGIVEKVIEKVNTKEHAKQILEA